MSSYKNRGIRQISIFSSHLLQFLLFFARLLHSLNHSTWVVSCNMFDFLFYSKTSFLQVYYHHVLLKCDGIIILSFADWTWCFVWSLVIYKLVLFMLMINILQHGFIRYIYHFIFFDRLYGVSTVGYHALYLPLLYVTFLADFFEVINRLGLLEYIISSIHLAFVLISLILMKDVCRTLINVFWWL